MKAETAPQDQVAAPLLTVGISTPDARSKRIDTLFIVVGVLLLLGTLPLISKGLWAKLGNYLAFVGSVYMGAPSARTMWALWRAPRAEIDAASLNIKGAERVQAALQKARTVHFVNFSMLDMSLYAAGLVLLSLGLFAQLWTS